MTRQEIYGALWALQITAPSRYTLEVAKIAMALHVDPSTTADILKRIYWADENQFRLWLLPRSLVKRYAGSTIFAGMTWSSWQDVLINDAHDLLDALNDNDFTRVHNIMYRDRITQAYTKTTPK